MWPEHLRIGPMTRKADAVRDGRDRMQQEECGLAAPTPGWWDGLGCVRLLGAKAYVPEGRASFLSLVPDRYRTKENA